MSIDARCYLFSYWRQIWKTLQLLINHLQYWAITNNAIIKQCNNWIIIRLLGEYVIWLLGKKGEGGENTKDRILDAAQIATKYTLQPECWVAVNTLGWILTLEKIRASLTIDRTFFFFNRKISLSSKILSMMAGKAFFCLPAMFYPNPVLRVPAVSVVFALLLILLLTGCCLHWGLRSSEESSALQPQRHVHAGYQGPARATGSRFTHSRGSSNSCWCM